ncbi:MAG: hypothetical protein NVS2B14_21020 [Chamaesiphon sp.]
MNSNPPVFPIPTEILLSIATGQVLLGMLAVQASSKWLQAAGIASEEVFRGDRLPILDFPSSNSGEP